VTFWFQLHETFLGITIDRRWCETHEISDINTHFHYQAWAATYTHWNIINKSMLRMFQRVVADISKHILYRHVSHVALVHHLCYMLIYEQMMLRLMQHKCQLQAWHLGCYRLLHITINQDINTWPSLVIPVLQDSMCLPYNFGWLRMEQREIEPLSSINPITWSFYRLLEGGKIWPIRSIPQPRNGHGLIIGFIAKAGDLWSLPNHWQSWHPL
jgi:hypothetical protein